jgi:hypothetical protein
MMKMMARRKVRLIRTKGRETKIRIKLMTRKRKNGIKLVVMFCAPGPTEMASLFRQKNLFHGLEDVAEKLLINLEFKGRHCITGDDRLSRYFS